MAGMCQCVGNCVNITWLVCVNVLGIGRILHGRYVSMCWELGEYYMAGMCQCAGNWVSITWHVMSQCAGNLMSIT